MENIEVKNTLMDNLKGGKLWKESPAIALGGSIILGGAALYFTWRAARKHDSVMDDIRKDLDDIHACRPNDDADKGEFKEYRGGLIKVYMRAGWKLGKLYAPAVVTEIGSIACGCFGYKTLSERLEASVAQAAVLGAGFAKYRENVIHTLGEDADREFRFGIKEKTIEKPVLDANGVQKVGKDGTPKTKKEKVLYHDNPLDIEGYSPYARIFCKKEGNVGTYMFDSDTYGEPKVAYNEHFLYENWKYFNQLLRSRKNHTVFLNEVYKNLGFDLTPEGQVVGWHYDKDDPTGDNYISFGLGFEDDLDGDGVADEILHTNKISDAEYILDFNVDGNVYELI